MENVSEITKIAHLNIDRNAKMAINCEWVWITLWMIHAMILANSRSGCLWFIWARTPSTNKIWYHRRPDFQQAWWASFRGEISSSSRLITWTNTALRNLYLDATWVKSCALPSVNSLMRVYFSLAKTRINSRALMYSKLLSYLLWRGVLSPPTYTSNDLIFPQWPDRWTSHDNRHIFSLLRTRNNSCRASILPCFG